MMTGEPEENPIDLLKETIADLDKEKQQIISVVSHDIKAPFNRILALVQLLEMDNNNLNIEQKQYLDKIHQVVADGLGMVRNLVDYRNLEYRGIDIHPEEINLKTFLEKSVKSFKALADKKNLTFHVKIPKEITIISDTPYLGRVADSLLSNAVKFSPEGKEIFVELEEVKDHIEIRVRDEARGFIKEDENRLFTKFQKLSNKPTGGESSTGLGLYITMLILNRLGGSIACKTKEGVGSTFTVTLPRVLKS